MLAYHLAIVLVVLLGFAHYGQKPVGRVTPPQYPPPPYRVWSCDIGKLWLSWKIGATLKVSNEYGSLGLNHCDSSGETGAVSAFRSFI